MAEYSENSLTNAVRPVEILNRPLLLVPWRYLANLFCEPWRNCVDLFGQYFTNTELTSSMSPVEIQRRLLLQTNRNIEQTSSTSAKEILAELLWGSC
jgi:hypothetical protein